MLVLSRRKGESIVIGEGRHMAVVTVVEVTGGRVRLGIDAARDVTIDRHEIHEAKQRNSRPSVTEG